MPMGRSTAEPPDSMSWAACRVAASQFPGRVAATRLLLVSNRNQGFRYRFTPGYSIYAANAATFKTMHVATPRFRCAGTDCTLFPTGATEYWEFGVRRLRDGVHAGAALLSDCREFLQPGQSAREHVDRGLGRGRIGRIGGIVIGFG